MEKMVKDLYKAAVEGSVTSLLDLVKKDELILERCIIVTSYAETPLHIAAMLGHLDFCSELVRRNPRLTREVDYRRSTALHIASAKGHVEIVIILVAACPEMCLSYDGDGLNPIHIAAMKGRVDVLEELVKANPDGVGARLRTCQGGTVMHLCVQYYQIEALKFLAEVQNHEELLNAKDDNGNSILHLSVGDKQVEMVEYLVSRTPIDVEALNSNGLTASNIVALQTKRDSKCMEIAHFLQLTSIQGLQQITFPPQNEKNKAYSSITIENLEESRSKSEKHQAVWLEKQRNSIMVVASLIATMAFQAGVSPPNDIFKRDSDIYEKFFMVSNTIGFLSSLSIILLLISGLPLRHKAFMWTWMAIMWISISATTFTYMISLGATSDWVDTSEAFDWIVLAWIDSIVVLLLLHTIRFLSYRIHGWPSKGRLYMWIFMIIVSVIIVLPSPYLLILSFLTIITDRVVFPRIVTCWIVLATFLIVLYAIQFVLFIIKKLNRCFKGFRSHLCSGDHRSNNVV